MPFISFTVIDGCKIDSSQSISTGNQIDSSLARKKRCRCDIRIVLERGGWGTIFLNKYEKNRCWINMTEVQKLGLKDFIVLKIFDAVWMLLEYPLKFLLLNLRPQGRYRMVFGYHFVQNFDPGFCHLVSGPPPGTGILHWKCEFVTLQSRPFCRSLEG